MALTQLFTNNAVSLLRHGISQIATSLTVLSGHGALFPSPGVNEYFLITLEDQTASNREIIRVTGRVGDVFTFDMADRGQEGTTIQAWAASAGNDTLVDHRVTADTMRLAMELPLATTPVLALGDLTDVNLSVPPLLGQVLKFNGTSWVPSTDISGGGGSGSVTSIDVSGGLTGLTTSGGPIISSGTITLEGLLNIAHGGTGATSASAALTNLLPSQAGNAGKILRTNGAAASWQAETVLSLVLYSENPVSPTAAVAAGPNAVAIGFGADANAAKSLAIGEQSLTRIPGSVVVADGRFGTQGDAQVGKYLVRGVSTSTLPVELLEGGTGGSRLALPDNSTWTFRATVTAHETSGTNRAGFELTGVIYRDGGSNSVALQGAVSSKVIGRSSTAWTVSAAPDTVNGALKFVVTGQAGKIIRWLAHVETVEVTN